MPALRRALNEEMEQLLLTCESSNEKGSLEGWSNYPTQCVTYLINIWKCGLLMKMNCISCIRERGGNIERIAIIKWKAILSGLESFRLERGLNSSKSLLVYLK